MSEKFVKFAIILLFLFIIVIVLTSESSPIYYTVKNDESTITTTHEEKEITIKKDAYMRYTITNSAGSLNLPNPYLNMYIINNSGESGYIMINNKEKINIQEIFAIEDYMFIEKIEWVLEGSKLPITLIFTNFKLQLSDLAFTTKEDISSSSYKPIPKGSKVEIQIANGTPAGSELNATIEPDDGYELDISYMILDVPSGVEANVLIKTSEGEYPLLAENTTTGVQIDASDFGGLGGISKIVLYAKVTSTPSEDITVSLEYGGRQVI